MLNCFFLNEENGGCQYISNHLYLFSIMVGIFIIWGKFIDRARSFLVLVTIKMHSTFTYMWTVSEPLKVFHLTVTVVLTKLYKF